MVLSAAELLDCFVLPSSSAAEAAEAGFGASRVPAWFEALLFDEAVFEAPRRLQLLQWCTARAALPLGGLRDGKVRPRLHKVTLRFVWRSRCDGLRLFR